MFGKRRRSAEDFKEEIASHLAHEADDLRDRAKCADPEAAARRIFGNTTKLEETSYERRHWMGFDHLKIDCARLFGNCEPGLVSARWSF